MKNKFCTLEELLKFLKEEESKWYYPILSFFRSIKYFIRDLKYLPNKIKYAYQRVKYGYSDEDVWGFDYYLTDIILGGIKILRTNLHGHPCTLNSCEEWEIVLIKIERTFTLIKEMLANNSIPIGMNVAWTEELYKEHVNKQRDFYVWTKKDSEDYHEGWELFKKYFINLWD